jgi:hypothetical protein
MWGDRMLAMSINLRYLLRLAAGGLALSVGLNACLYTYAIDCEFNERNWQGIEGVAGEHSAARVMDELALAAIRRVLPQPTNHSRNLFHLSAAMYDAWAAYDDQAQGVFFNQKVAKAARPADIAAAQREAVYFAGLRVLSERFPMLDQDDFMPACFQAALTRAKFDPNNLSQSGETAASIGNRAAAAVLASAKSDGASLVEVYKPINEVLHPERPGINMADPNRWQRLELRQPFTQNGIRQSGPQPFMGFSWYNVRPFAMTSRQNGFYHDPGPAPSQSGPELRELWLPDLLRKQSQLDPSDPTTIDISPGAYGNNSIGQNDGSGHPLNPATGQPYPPQVVKRADFGRVLAEYWADGPASETPPGHWNVVANKVADAPSFGRRLFGQGGSLGKLEWDVKLYLALNGALHDAAITAWEIKRKTESARPISLVRYMATRDPRGLPMIPGLIERRSVAGQMQVQVRSWHYSQGMTWATADSWVPYQSDNFVTPAFPGFVSGHSTFSRAAAEVLTDLTGSAFFPGGLAEFVAQPGFLRIDRETNSDPVRLQWATYYDAADQAGQSRIWGGIHIEPDDLVGRKLGRLVGLDAAALAKRYFAGTGVAAK